MPTPVGVVDKSKRTARFGRLFLFLGHALADQFLYQTLNVVSALQELYDVIINAIPQIDLHLLHVLAVVFNSLLDVRSPLGFRQLLRHLPSSPFNPKAMPVCQDQHPLLLPDP